MKESEVDDDYLDNHPQSWLNFVSQNPPETPDLEEHFNWPKEEEQEAVVSLEGTGRERNGMRRNERVGQDFRMKSRF